MASSNCWLWSFRACNLGWNEHSDAKDDSFMDVYKFWISDVNNAFVWFADQCSR